jgi:predicted permease
LRFFKAKVFDNTRYIENDNEEKAYFQGIKASSDSSPTAIPALIMIVLKLIGISDEIMTLALIAFATPLGLNTIVYPAAYGGDTKTGASMATISHTLSVITIPLMYLVFIVLL